MTGEKPEVLIGNGGRALTAELSGLHSVPNQSAVLPSQGAFQNLSAVMPRPEILTLKLRCRTGVLDIVKAHHVTRGAHPGDQHCRCLFLWTHAKFNKINGVLCKKCLEEFSKNKHPIKKGSMETYILTYVK